MLSQSGAGYRTKLMSEARAFAFAKALQGNRRFAFVTLSRSSRAKGAECFFVQFQPSNVARGEALLRREQDARTERAGSQTFTFAANRHEVWCYSHGSGNTYQLSVDGRTCSCPDAQYRANGNGLCCKHGVAWLASEERREMEQAQRERAERNAAFDRIFLT